MTSDKDIELLFNVFINRLHISLESVSFESFAHVLLICLASASEWKGLIV